MVIVGCQKYVAEGLKGGVQFRNVGFNANSMVGLLVKSL